MDMIKGIFSLFLILLPIRNLDAAEIRFHLPVRITPQAAADQPLQTEDFQLLINGSPRDVLAVKRKQKSLLFKPDLGREFIISFRLAKYDPAIEKELAFFITEILDTSDSLYILTPGQLYRLNVSVNKGSIQRQIRELLEKDCRAFRDERMTAEARLRNSLEALNSVLGDDPQGVDTYKKTSLFLNVFPEEFIRYQNRFLLPDPKRYAQVLGQFGFGEGERWWIHFEQHQGARLYQKIQAIIRDIDKHISVLAVGHQDLALVMKTSLNRLEKILTLPDSFPSAELIEVLLSNEVNYSIVFMKSDDLKETHFAETPFLNLEVFYSEIARAGGGAAVNAGADEQGLARIVSHVDEHYELAFGWDDARLEDIHIQVLVKGQTDALRYAEHLTRAQVESRVQFLSRDKIRIEDVSVSAGRLSFVVDAFERKKEADYGLLKIRVLLLDDRKKSVYREENTLRATKEKVSVSLPFPEELKGAFELSITACDLLANRLTAEKRQIDLK